MLVQFELNKLLGFDSELLDIVSSASSCSCSCYSRWFTPNLSVYVPMWPNCIGMLEYLIETFYGTLTFYSCSKCQMST